MKRGWRVAVRLLAGMLAGAAVVLAAGAWIVAAGPVSIGFLTPLFEDALVFEDTGIRVELGDTVLAWGGWRRNLDLNAVDVRIVGADGAVIAEVPRLSVSLSAAAALRGRLAPLHIEILEPELAFERTAAGRFRLGGLEGGDEQAGPLVQALLVALGRPRAPGTIVGYLESVQITDAVLWLRDLGTGETWHAPQADAMLERRGTGFAGDLDVQLDLDGVPLRLAAAAEFSGVTGVMTLATAFSGLNPSRFAGASPALARLGAVRAPVSGTVTAVFEADGAIARIDYDLSAGAGTLDIPEVWRRPQPFDQLAARGSLSDGLTLLRFDEAFAALGDTSGQAEGFATFDPEEGIGLSIDASWSNVSVADFSDSWPWRLARRTRDWLLPRAVGGVIRDGALQMRVKPGRFRNPPLQVGEVEMTFTFDGGEMWLLPGQPPVTGARGDGRHSGDRFEMTIAEGRLGTLEISEGTVQIDGMDTWTRSAVIEGVATGAAAEFARQFSLPPLNLTGIPTGIGGNVAARSQFAFPAKPGIAPEEVKFAAAANVREFSLAAIAGRRQLTDGTFVVRADSVGIDAQGAAVVDGVPLTIELRHDLLGGEAPTRLRVTGILDDATREAQGLGTDRLIVGPMPFTAAATGDRWDMAEVIVDLDLADVALSPPIHAWDKAAGAPGTARVRVVPRADGILEVPEFSIAAPNLAANGQLAVDPAEGRAIGAGAVNGIGFDLDWQRLRGDGEAGSRLVLRGSLDASARAEIGYPTGDWLAGPVDLAVELLADGLRTQVAEVSVDFAPAVVRLPLWEKAAGMDGVAKLSLAPGPGGRYEFRSFAVSSGGLVASGTILNDADGAPAQLELARLVFGETRLKGTIAWDAAGAFRVGVGGERLDLRPLLEEMTAAANEGTLPPLALVAEFDEVILSDTRMFSALRVHGEQRGGNWSRLDLAAALPSGAPFTASVTGGPDSYAVVATTTDSGELFREFGIFQGAEGGNMDLRGTYAGPPGQKVFDGGVLVDAFRVANAPALAQILSLASLTGLNDVMQGQGINFVGFEAPFKYRNGDVAVGRARAFGPALGITVEGQFNGRTGAVNLAGTVVPAYTINRVLGAIPLLGELLVGEGVFAIAYRVTGDRAQPTITVNPLSALTPGFLRGLIFGFQPDASGAAAPQPPPEPPPPPGG